MACEFITVPQHFEFDEHVCLIYFDSQKTIDRRLEKKRIRKQKREEARNASNEEREEEVDVAESGDYRNSNF